MNFDLNTLANFAQIFGKTLNGDKNSGETRQNKPQNADFRARAHNHAKSFDGTSFAAQNGLGEKIDISTMLNGDNFEADNKNNQKSNTPQNNSNAQNPLESILNLLGKKNDAEKFMPALANIFSSKQKQDSEQTKQNSTKPENTSPQNAVKSAEINKKSKSEDIFVPIGFAGYTTLSAVNRLYFALKN